LTFNDDEIHQVVSTLIVDDPEGGVKSVTFGKPKGFGQRRLIGEDNKGFENLLLELRGARIKCSFENKQVSYEFESTEEIRYSCNCLIDNGRIVFRYRKEMAKHERWKEH
jgi:hypothetical protein